MPPGAVLATASSLVGYWPLDETTGNAIDREGAADLVPAGGTRQGLPGALDEARTAYAFERVAGSAATRSSAVSSLTDGFTIEAWLRADANPTGSRDIAVWNGTSADGWGIGINTSGRAIGMLTAGSEDTVIASATDEADGRWHHVALVRSSGTATLWVDGVAVATTTTAPGSPGAGFTIGAQTASVQPFRGEIDEVAVYSAALAGSAIAARIADGLRSDAVSNLTTRTRLDVLGRPVDVVDPEGTISRREYDRAGRLTAISANWRDGVVSAGTGDDDARTTFGYNEASELTELCTARHVVAPSLGGSDCDVTDRADPAAWHYHTDAAGHRTVEIGPDNVSVTDLTPTWRWYDPSGRLVTVCSRANFANDSCTNANVTRHTEYAYDDLGRFVSSSLYAGDGTTDVELVTTTTYLGDGAVASVTGDETGMGGSTDSLTFTYDAYGRLDLVKDGTVTLTDHAWNADDTLASRADGTAGTIAFTYDWADRLITVDPPNTTFGSGSNITRAWRLDGLLGSVTYPSGMTATTGYDAARRPVSIDLGAAGSFAAAYDRTGDVTSESRTLTGITGSAGTGAQAFTYDGFGRLASATLAGVTTTYDYDLDGNRTSSTTGGVTTAWSYDRTGVLADRSIAGGMAYTFSYDPYGNLTGEPDAAGAVTTYSLDLADRLTSFDPPTTAATTYGYDALARIVTRVRPDGTDTYRFVGTSEQVAGISVSGTGTAIASLVEPAGGRPLTKQGSTTYAALPDVGGSTGAVAAVSGSTITGAVRFDPWGMKLDETTTTGVGPFRYRGALELAPAGADPLYESGARLYRPGLAAFTSLDSYAGSALEPASLNRYLYAQANPATLIDPSGHVAINPNQLCGSGEDCSSDFGESIEDRAWAEDLEDDYIARSVDSGGATPTTSDASIEATFVNRPTGPRPSTTILTEYSNLPAEITNLRISSRAGAGWELQVRQMLEGMYDPDLYEIRQNLGLRNERGRLVRVNDRYFRPDFQVINRASNRLAAIYEAKSGSLAYLTRALGKIRLCQTAATQLGYTAPRVDMVPQLRLRPRAFEFAARATGALQLLSIVVGVWADSGEQERRNEFLRTFETYDPDLAHQYALEWGYVG